ncbi:protein kinase domain protein, partial [Ichthyophthirius multifiliis]
QTTSDKLNVQNIYSDLNLNLTTKNRESDNFSFQNLTSQQQQYSNQHKQYQKLCEIGEGSYGKVLQVKHKETNQQYAMKIIRKDRVTTNQRIMKSTLLEKNILLKSNHPFIIKLYQSFQSQFKLYLVIEYMPNGDIYSILQRVRVFNESTAKFIIVQVILGIEYLHEKIGVMYRDLKPENVLIDELGYIKLADFGLAKEIGEENISSKETAPLGTPQYLAPEIVLRKPHKQNVDFWTIGIFLYEMIAGRPPFCAKGQQNLYKQIIQNNVQFTSNFSFEAQDFIKNLLQSNPEMRIGAQGFDSIKKHAFFFNINWKQIINKESKSPLLQYTNQLKIIKKQQREQSIYESPKSTNDIINFPLFSYDPKQSNQIQEQLQFDKNY